MMTRLERSNAPARRIVVVLALAAVAAAGACARPVGTHQVVVGAVLDGAAYDSTRRAAGAASLADAFRADSFVAAGLTLPYRLLEPASPAAGARYPLVVVLHGSGEMGRDNRAQLGPFARTWAHADLAARFPAYVVVPQFATRSAEYAPDPADGLPSATGTPALEAALALVEELRATRAVDPDRIYLVGFSMGGSSAWQALVRRPGLFAAAVPIGGVPLARAVAPALAGTPVLIVHGSADDQNPFAAARAMYDALLGAGARGVRLREYPGLGHQVPAELFGGTAWRDWLFAQRRAAAGDEGRR